MESDLFKGALWRVNIMLENLFHIHMNVIDCQIFGPNVSNGKQSTENASTLQFDGSFESCSERGNKINHCVDGNVPEKKDRMLL